MRRHRSYFPLFLILALLFMLVGDRLPAPVGPLGVQAKKNVNTFVIGLFPSWNPKLNPNQRTESQLEQVEKNK